MLKKIFRNTVKPHQIPKKIISHFNYFLTQFFINKKKKVFFEDQYIFTMRDFSKTTNMRIISFSTKEPETLKWINDFNQGDKLLDIGANVGVYSLYAASRGYEVAAIEPDALNFALLNLNVHDNHFNDLITAYPYSVHAYSKLSILNIPGYNWGGTASSFDRCLDWQGEQMNASFKQGSPGISVDDFVESSGFFPNHIKIDIDGNEFLVLQGAKKVLNHPQCKSVLVEMYENHPEFKGCIQILTENNFVLSEKSQSPIQNGKAFQAENYIFHKVIR